MDGTDDLPPVDSYVCVKWSESGDEPPGWYRARIDQYFSQGKCKVVYDDNDDENIVYEIFDLREALNGSWPGSKRAKKFVPLHDNPIVRKSTWKHSSKFTNSQTHSLKEYADDVTLLSNDVDAHTSVLQTIDRKTADQAYL